MANRAANCRDIYLAMMMCYSCFADRTTRFLLRASPSRTTASAPRHASKTRYERVWIRFTRVMSVSFACACVYCIFAHVFSFIFDILCVHAVTPMCANMSVHAISFTVFVYASACVRRRWMRDSTVTVYRPRPAPQALFQAQRNYVAVTTSPTIQAIAVNFARELTGREASFEKVPYACIDVKISIYVSYFSKSSGCDCTIVPTQPCTPPNRTHG